MSFVFMPVSFATAYGKRRQRRVAAGFEPVLRTGSWLPYAERRLPAAPIAVFTDLVADDAAGRRAADRSESAPARQRAAGDSAHGRAGHGALLSRTHARACGQHGERQNCKTRSN